MLWLILCLHWGPEVERKLNRGPNGGKIKTVSKIDLKGCIGLYGVEKRKKGILSLESGVCKGMRLEQQGVAGQKAREATEADLWKALDDVLKSGLSPLGTRSYRKYLCCEQMLECFRRMDLKAIKRKMSSFREDQLGEHHHTQHGTVAAAVTGMNGAGWSRLHFQG